MGENNNNAAARRRPGSPRRKILTRYLAGQKLSDYQVEKVIRAFADGVLAADLARSEKQKKIGPVSAKTIFRIYDLLRHRLLELGVFPAPARYLDFWRNDEVGSHTFPFSQTAQAIQDLSHRLRGASNENTLAHVAEIIFRAENRDLPSGAFFILIQQAIKVTGPLNTPPENLDVWAEYASIIVYEHNVRDLRRDMAANPVAHRMMIDNYQIMIEERLQTIRRIMRSRGSRSLFRVIDGGTSP